MRVWIVCHVSADGYIDLYPYRNRESAVASFNEILETYRKECLVEFDPDSYFEDNAGAQCFIQSEEVQ